MDKKYFMILFAFLLIISSGILGASDVIAKSNKKYYSLEDKIDDLGSLDVLVMIKQNDVKGRSSAATLSNIAMDDKKELKLIDAYSGTVDRNNFKKLQKLSEQGLISIYEDRKLYLLKEKPPEISTSLAISTIIIGANYSWEILNLTGRNINIAVIDSGIDYRHPDLGGCMGAGCKVLDGYDFVNNDSDPLDDYGHGTHVAGIISANGTIRGVAPDSKLYALKSCNAVGTCQYSDIIQALEWCIDNSVNIISMSIGGSNSDNIEGNSGEDALSLAVDSIITDNGIPIVIAAGNDGPAIGTINIPGAAKKAITVGAINDLSTIGQSDDEIASFSSRGPSGFGRLDPDISAPGIGINSTYLNNGTETLPGTSMATPHITGAIALMLENDPALTPAKIRSMIIGSAANISGKTLEKGSGEINIRDVLLSQAYATVYAEDTYSINTTTDRWEFIAKPSGISYANVTVYNNNGFEVIFTLLKTDMENLENSLMLDNSQLSLPDSISVPANDTYTFSINFSLDDFSTEYATTYAGAIILLGDNGYNISIPVVITVPITTNTSISRTMQNSGAETGDVLSYVYKSQSTGNKTINISWISTDNDLDLYIYDSNGILINNSGVINTESESIIIESDNQSIIWIRVHGFYLDSAPLDFNINISENIAPYITSYYINRPIIRESDTGYEYSLLINWSESMNTSRELSINFYPEITLGSCTMPWINATMSNYSCTIEDTNISLTSNISANISNAQSISGVMMDPYMLSNAIASIDNKEPALSGSSSISHSRITDADIGEILVIRLGFTESMNQTQIPVMNFIPDIESSGLLNVCNDAWQNSTIVNRTCSITGEDTTIPYPLNLSMTSAYDTQGNMMDPEVYFSIIDYIDTTEPVLDVDSPVNSATYEIDDIDLNFTVSGQDDCWYDISGTNISITGCNNITIYNLSEGSHELLLYANDSVNNVAEISTTFTIDIPGNDTDPPLLNITVLPSNSVLGPDDLPYLIIGNATDSGSGLNASSLSLYINRIYNATITNISSGYWNYSWNPPDGRYNMSVYACDNDDNCNESSIRTNIIIDLTAPITTPSATSNAWNSTFNILLTATDLVSQISLIYYKIGSLSWQNNSGDTASINISTSTNISSGNTTIYYYSVDTRGNTETTKNITVLFDKTAPSTALVAYQYNGSSFNFDLWGSSPALINFSGSDAHSGYNKTIYCNDTINLCTPSAEWNATLNISSPGVNYLRYRSVDNLSNLENITFKRIMILNNTSNYINSSITAGANNSVIIVAQNSTSGSNLIVPINVNASLDLNELVNGTSLNATFPIEINITSNTSNGIIIIRIPARMMLIGDADWLGRFNLPKSMPSSSVDVDADSGKNVVLGSIKVIEIGADEIGLLTNGSVRINFSGRSGKYAGYSRDGNFYKITSTCLMDNITWANQNLSSNSSCKMNSGNDLIILTKHFTKFVTYDQENEDNSPGGGGGGSNTISGIVSSNSLSFGYQTLAVGTKEITLNSINIPLYKYFLTTNVPLTNVGIRISKLDIPQMIYPGRVYRYIKIDHTSIPDATVNSIRLQFKVDKGWMINNSLKSSDIMMPRYVTQWTQSGVKILNEDSGYVYYEAAINGPGFFAIAAENPNVIAPVANITPINVTNNQTPITGAVLDSKSTDAGVTDVQTLTQSENKGITPLVRFIISGVSLIVLVTVIYFLYMKHKKST